MTTAVEPLIELVDVDLSFGDVRALEGITLTVARGDFLGLIGPNGSGKTTLLRVLLGLTTPDRGQVRLFGQPPAEFGEWRRVGYVPQRLAIDATLPVTVDEVVRTGLLGAGWRGRRAASLPARVDEVLARVGMAPQLHARIGALSVGQQQRVLIARALVSEPELLVLDEPTSGVDPEAQTSFYELLHDLHRSHGVTLILVSHDIGVVAKEVTRLACLNRRLVFHGPPADFLGDDAALAALYGPAVRVVTHDHA